MATVPPPDSTPGSMPSFEPSPAETPGPGSPSPEFISPAPDYDAPDPGGPGIGFENPMPQQGAIT